MRKIVFSCSENMNEHEEVFEFGDDMTDEDIQQEFEDWVWNEIGDNYCWYNKSDD